MIVFDRYLEFGRWDHGEFRAFQGDIQATGQKYDYPTYDPTLQQVPMTLRWAVESTESPIQG